MLEYLQSQKASKLWWIHLSERLKAREDRLDEALRYNAHLIAEINRLRKRRVVRFALSLAASARPFFVLWRRVRKTLTTLPLFAHFGPRKLALSYERAESSETELSCENLMLRGEWAEAQACWVKLSVQEQFVGEASVAPRSGIAITSALVAVRKSSGSQLFLQQPTSVKTSGTRAGVVFGACFGDVDDNWHPGWAHPDLNYIRYVDSPMQSSETFGILEFRPSEYSGSSPRRSARWVKMHPDVLFPDTRWAVWMDTNLISLTSWDEVFESFTSSESPIALIQHPLREFVESEAAECIIRGKETPEKIRELIARNGPDPGLGLFETGLVMYDLHHPALKPLLSRWWSLTVGSSLRDQVTLPYALRDIGISPHILIPSKRSVRSDSRFALIPHRNPAWSRAHREIATHYGVARVQPQTTSRLWKDARIHLLQLQRHRRVDVVVPINNALPYVRRCISSVLDSRDANIHRIILVDDGSSAETAAHLDEVGNSHPNVEILRSPIATGFCRAANRGLRASTGEMTIVLNSDTEVVGEWIYKLADAMFRPSGIGIVGPFSNAASFQSWPRFEPDADEALANQTVINRLEGDLLDLNQLFEETASIHPTRTDLIHGFCFGIRREVIADVGYFDENLFPDGYGEEVDYCFRAVDAGWSLAWATNTFVAHAQSASYGTERRNLLATRGKTAVIARHGRERHREAIAAALEQRRAALLPQLPLTTGKRDELACLHEENRILRQALDSATGRWGFRGQDVSK